MPGSRRINVSSWYNLAQSTQGRTAASWQTPRATTPALSADSIPRKSSTHLTWTPPEPSQPLAPPDHITQPGRPRRETQNTYNPERASVLTCQKNFGRLRRRTGSIRESPDAAVSHTLANENPGHLPEPGGSRWEASIGAGSAERRREPQPRKRWGLTHPLATRAARAVPKARSDSQSEPGCALVAVISAWEVVPGSAPPARRLEDGSNVQRDGDGEGRRAFSSAEADLESDTYFQTKAVRSDA